MLPEPRYSLASLVQPYAYSNRPGLMPGEKKLKNHEENDAAPQAVCRRELVRVSAASICCATTAIGYYMLCRTYS